MKTLFILGQIGYPYYQPYNNDLTTGQKVLFVIIIVVGFLISRALLQWMVGVTAIKRNQAEQSEMMRQQNELLKRQIQLLEQQMEKYDAQYH